MWFYKHVSERFLHMKAHIPSTDKCNTCTLLHLQGNEEELSLHQMEASKFRKQLKQDATHKLCITFDLQQVRPLPLIKADKAFYH